jgi:hypothetical protein
MEAVNNDSAPSDTGEAPAEDWLEELTPRQIVAELDKYEMLEDVPLPDLDLVPAASVARRDGKWVPLGETTRRAVARAVRGLAPFPRPRVVETPVRPRRRLEAWRRRARLPRSLRSSGTSV